MLRSLCCGCVQSTEKGDSTQQDEDGGYGQQEEKGRAGGYEDRGAEKVALNDFRNGGEASNGFGRGGAATTTTTGGFDGPAPTSLPDALKMSLLSIRARRRLIRDVPVAVEPTRFDDDEQVEEEDEEGEETHVLINGTYCGQNYERLKAACLRSGRMFVDPEFPPCDVSMFFDSGNSDPTIEWKRPGEICEDPRFVF